MEFSRQEYWSGLPRSPPGDFPDPGIELTSPKAPAFQEGSLLPVKPKGEWYSPKFMSTRICEWNLIWSQGLCRRSQDETILSGLNPDTTDVLTRRDDSGHWEKAMW